mmetsp:Transcript_38433/g.81471  ORF Transcript_38433/g.81471 Transcript_38433/m.81471 type:complete len:445 (-) Transcript_38433:153-1487(-)
MTVIGASQDSSPKQQQQQQQTRLTPLWVLKAIWFLGVGANASLFRFITVFYHKIELDTTHIGFLQLCNPWVTFAGSLSWASVCDRTGAYKQVLVASNILGVTVVCCLLIPFVQQHFSALLACMVVGPAFLSSRAGVTDALTNKVMAEYRAAALQNGTESQVLENASYGRQRLWGALGYGGFALLSGLLVDAFGNNSMFMCFAACLGTTVIIIATQLPSDPDRNKNSSGPQPGNMLSLMFGTFEASWFFANLLVYGVHLALVETFLFVYLVRDFEGTTSTLLGLSVSTMCLFELPVFYYIQVAINRYSLTTLLSGCHIIFAIRVFLYSVLPKSQPWLVLLIEPLHGITAAGMWSCSVEFGRRLAPEHSKARMQAIASGVYYRAASGAGSLIWSYFTRPEPEGYGFPKMYALAGVTMLCWSLLWNFGWRQQQHKGWAGCATSAIDS